MTPLISFKIFQSILLNPWLQNIYVSNFPNSLNIILNIRYMDLCPYSIVNLYWKTSVGNVSLVHISTECTNIFLDIFTTILMVCSADSFWCEAPSPLNLIFCYFFNRSSINSEVFNIPLLVWGNSITTPWLWSSLLNKILLQVLEAIYRTWK